MWVLIEIYTYYLLSIIEQNGELIIFHKYQ